MPRSNGRQKAPSAKRCIKTLTITPDVVRPLRVRKHRAPKGALRPVALCEIQEVVGLSQKAPSAKRCIKTVLVPDKHMRVPVRQKAPSAKRCIKTNIIRTSLVHRQ